MGGGKALGELEHWWIVGLHDVPLREISRKTGRSRTCLRKVIKEERGPRTDESGERPRAGRQPSLSEREVRLLVRAAAKGDCFTREIKTRFRIKASVRMNQRLLKTGDHLVYTKMVRTLPLTAAHKTAHMNWPEEHILKQDGKKFNIDDPDGFKYLWRDMRRPAQSYVHRQNGGGNIMVWGAFSAAGKSKLAILRGRQNSGDYIYTVSEYLLPFAHGNYGVDFVFQQDNASIHASRETKQLLEENEVSTMVWPARSPDCNPIESVWSAMAAKVYAHGRQYRTVAELEEAVLAAWDVIGKEYLLKLVESMPRRCLAVIKQKGGLTKY
ncbi:hypothetical protein PC115_g15024 [Phytophthora cactorum]|uniref:Tc1-like transposase DDE domain-containing protein n=1 Tax=Phytophthora cactorum TaxID=29920 RepID=A0A8T1CGY8_9STRA|nr:hypothetical protein PC115_g15024 [Phytophthora cactorum]KAG2920584.1 hypothetical protein PC117_g16449 [Phytophthora cactorum]KAG3009069.1 hypothetical protein PC120_g15849 [Phytophthora cactorum]KAG3059632.1 hypothetical protein PC121_g13884 [Phytophthora cactorum]KAG3157542.1 hypothetical protein C6341_g14690 [Phytophthora cactorum]